MIACANWGPGHQMVGAIFLCCRLQLSPGRAVSWTPEEFKVESSEHQDDSNIHCQPFPESVSEEHEIYTDYDGYHRHHVKHERYLSAHFSLWFNRKSFLGRILPLKVPNFKLPHYHGVQWSICTAELFRCGCRLHSNPGIVPDEQRGKRQQPLLGAN